MPKRKPRRFPRETIKLEELLTMHEAVKNLVKRKRLGPGTEGYSLLASLGSCIGLHPCVKAKTVARLRNRYRSLLDGTRPDVPERQHVKAHVSPAEAADRRGLPCEHCGADTPADDLTLRGDEFLCPGCCRYLDGNEERVMAMIAARHGELTPF